MEATRRWTVGAAAIAAGFWFCVWSVWAVDRRGIRRRTPGFWSLCMNLWGFLLVVIGDAILR